MTLCEAEVERVLIRLLESSGRLVVGRQYRIGSKSVDLIVREGEALVSIEVKVRDWRKAAHQARLNMPYFDRSYIALPANPRRRLDFNRLAGLGVGVIEFDENRMWETLAAIGTAVSPLTRAANERRLPA